MEDCTLSSTEDYDHAIEGCQQRMKKLIEGKEVARVKEKAKAKEKYDAWFASLSLPAQCIIRLVEVMLLLGRLLGYVLVFLLVLLLSLLHYHFQAASYGWFRR